MKPGRNVIRKDASLTCMTIVDPATVWFDIVEIPRFESNEIALGNDEYIDKSSARVSHMFNNTWL